MTIKPHRPGQAAALALDDFGARPGPVPSGPPSDGCDPGGDEGATVL